MSHPMRLLVRLILDVKNGKFDPDLTRSGALASELAGESESSEGSTDEECKQVSEEERAVEDVVGEWDPGHGPDEHFARHLVSRCIHKVRDEAGSQLVCGRTISTRFEVLNKKPAFMHPLCSGCFSV